MYERYLKRVMDLLLAGVAFIVLAPLTIVVALAIKLDDGGPVFFRQERVGQRGARFVLLKFRSMKQNVGDLPSDRATALPITKVGRVLRRTNVDELPQLVSILRGDMSIVGPRPALPAQEQLLELRERYGAAHLRPGLTGLAQVRSYDGMPVTHKAELDGQYAARVTAVRDVAIIFATVGYLFRRPPTY
jgi:O-antigen biosynthesis protein WbqP